VGVLLGFGLVRVSGFMLGSFGILRVLVFRLAFSGFFFTVPAKPTAGEAMEGVL
jgi:hypothetical protein